MRRLQSSGVSASPPWLAHNHLAIRWRRAQWHAFTRRQSENDRAWVRVAESTLCRQTYVFMHTAEQVTTQGVGFLHQRSRALHGLNEQSATVSTEIPDRDLISMRILNGETSRLCSNASLHAQNNGQRPSRTVTSGHVTVRRTLVAFLLAVAAIALLSLVFSASYLETTAVWVACQSATRSPQSVFVRPPARPSGLACPAPRSDGFRLPR